MKKAREGLRINRIVILSAIVIFITAFVVTMEYFGYCYRQIDRELQITINSEIKRNADAEYTLENYEKVQKNTGDYLFDYCTYYLNEYGVSIKNIDLLASQIPINLYFLSIDEVGNQRLLTAVGCDYLRLSEKEISTLIEQSSYESIDDTGKIITYRSVKLGNGYFISGCNMVDFAESGYDAGKPYTTKTDEVLIWVDSEKNVISSNDERFENRAFSEVLQESDEENDSEICYVDKMGWCIVKKQTDGDNRLYAILPIYNCASEVIRSAMVPVALLIVVFVMLLSFVIRVKKEGAERISDKKRKYIQITKKICLDRMMASHIISMAVFGIILIGMTMFYVSALISYSNQSIIANENLQGLSDNYDRICKNDKNTDEIISYDLLSYGNYIAYGFMANPESMNSDTLKMMVNYIPSIIYVRVTDGSATIVASTINDTGYTFGKNDNEINENCWKIMDGERDYAICKPQEDNQESNMYAVLLRRQDAKGVIIIGFDVGDFVQMREKWNLAEVMLTTDMGDATCIAYKQENPDTIYVAEPDANEILYLDQNLGDKVTNSGYTGFQRVQGVKYFLTTIYNSDNDVCFISALPTKKIPYSVAVECLISIVIGMVIFVLILLGTCRINLVEGTENNSSAIFSNIDDLMDERFKIYIRNMIIINGILLVLLLGLDYLIQDKPLLEYLLSSQWNKGVNLFSVTMIILVMVGCAFWGFVLNKLVMLIFSNMGSRGMTVGNLLSSLMRFVFLIVAILWSLKELGVNMSALIAGAGIAGAAISFCASATINDLISGFFIVFEGAFKIGDWITVGDWRGQVVSIGIRTTKIACSDCVKIINNSTMTNVTVLDYTNCGAIAQIEVAYKENIEQVIDLLNNSREVFRNEIPEIQEGPYVRGVVELGTNGVTIEMYALGDQENIAKIERGIRLVAKRLFDENDIEIPFMQVTIHN